MSGNVGQNLNPKEKDIVEKLLGPSREQIFTGIAEVWLGQNSAEEDWGQKQGIKLKGCSPGVVCFIKDLDKENFQLWVISMSEGNVAWKQNIDKHILTQRRRRWIFVLDFSYSKLCLNFVDDDEADDFAYVLYGKFPEFQSFKNATPYTVNESGKVLRNNKKQDHSSKQRQKENFLVNVANLPKSVLEDPNYKEEVEAFFEEYGEELEDMADIFDNYVLETDDENGSGGSSIGEEDGGSSLNDQHDSEVASPSLDFTSCFDMGEYSAVDMEDLALDTVPEDVVTTSTYPKPPETPSKKSKPNRAPPPPPLHLPETSSEKSTPNRAPPPPPLNLKKSSKPQTSSGGSEPGQRISLLDEIRNNKMALKKSPINKNSKQNTKPRGTSIKDSLLGAMQQMRAVRETDYGIQDDFYRPWDDDE